jgi:fluoride exporter
MQIIYIGLGGFLGSVARFLVAKYFNSYSNTLPFGTLIVNVSGSLLLGFILYSVANGKNIPAEFRDFMTIGFIGAYTTMSTFAYESFRLAELNEIIFFALNLFLNIFLCLLAVYFGKELALLITK